MTAVAYTKAWQAARAAALTEAQQASPLAARPYDLRHYADGWVMRPAAVFSLAGAAELVL